MKRAFLQLFEHKSRDKKPEVTINQDAVKALEKMIRILSKSLDPKLTGQKEKITLAKEKTEKIILKKQQKKKDIEHLTEKISQKNLLIKDSSNTKGLDSQSKEERYKKLRNEIFALEIEFHKLTTPEPLNPVEMVDVLGSLPEYSTLEIEPDWFNVIDSLSVTMAPPNLIYISDNFVNKIFINYIKKEIVLRKSFLKESTQNLSIVTKLPDKVGDMDNILGVVKNLQENSKSVFTCDQELYSSQIDALAEPLQLLLKVRGKLKIWLDVDKFVRQHKITDGSLVKMVKKAKLPDGGGIFNFLGEQELNDLVKLLDRIEPLTKGYWLFYKTFVNKDDKDFLLSQLKLYKKSLVQQIKVGFGSFIKGTNLDKQTSSPEDSDTIIKIGEKYFQNLQQKNLSEIIGLFLNKQVSLIVLDYFDNNTAFRLNNHYQKQLECTNLAIKILSARTYKGIPVEESETVSFYPNWLKADFFSHTINFLNNYFQHATNPLGRNKIINIILGYVIEKDMTDTELLYLSDLARYNLEKKLLFLQSTKKILNFCQTRFTDDHVETLKKNLQFLEPIEIETHSSEFLKIIDIKNTPLMIILETIDLIMDTVKFFRFENIQRLNSLDKSVKKEIEKIERHLSEQIGPKIKSLVTTAFDRENELLDNFSYLIDYEKHKKSSKKASPFKLLNLLINLSKYAKFCPEKLLTQKSLNKIITLNQDSIIAAIEEFNDTES